MPDAIETELVVIDIGQSGSRLRATDGADYRNGPAFDAQLGVLASIERTLLAAGTPQAGVLVLSLTGLRGEAPDPSAIGRRCAELTGARAVGIADDGFAAHAGALGGADGVVLAVGSGVAVVARNADLACHRDGDGPVLGDDGGGFWIGREGLRAAVRASEDRGPATRLVADFEADNGPLRTAIRTKSDGEAMRWCITAARQVLEAAAGADPVAMSIRNRAATYLAATAASAWRAVGSPSEVVRYSYTGGVMADEQLRAALHAQMLEHLPHAVCHAPAGDNLDGALAIGRAPHDQIPPLLRWWHQ